MSFSDFFGEPPHEDPFEQQEFVSPEWFGPPDAELGAYVPLGLVVGRSDRGVVAISHAVGYSTGIGFELVALARGLSHRDTQRLFHEQHVPPDPDEPAAGFLRVGLELPDGARVSNLRGRRGWHDAESPPPGPVLFEHGGSGGMSDGRGVSMRPAFWMWPVPPPGKIRLSCEWPVVGISFSSVDLDAGPLRGACGNALRLWRN